MKFTTIACRIGGGAGIDGGGLLQDGPVLQGDHIWVKVGSDNGLEIAHTIKPKELKV